MENQRLIEECLRILNEIKQLVIEIRHDIHIVNKKDS